MLITFKSKSAADILMYQDHAKCLLDLLGKEIDRGIITVAEMPDAIQKLEAEILDSQLHPILEEIKQDVASHHNDQQDDNAHGVMETVTFAARAYPVLAMLKLSEQDGFDVTWGV